MNAIDIIKSYKNLLDEGIIDQSDFEAKKNELLANGKDEGDQFALLKGYKELLDANVISQEDFDKKKRSLLDQVTNTAGTPDACTGTVNAFAQSPVPPNAAPASPYPQNPMPNTAMPYNAAPANMMPNNYVQPKANRASSKAKTKKILTGVIIAAVVAALAAVVVFVVLPGRHDFKDLPGGVQMGDSRSTVISKADKIGAADSDLRELVYELDDGEVYGYHFEELDFWVSDEEPLNWVAIYFDDPKLDMDTLVKQVSKVYGEPSVTSENDYLWDTGAMQVLVSYLPNGTLYLDFYLWQ